MNTTIDFLDALKAKLGVTSDYGIAPVLGVTRSAVSVWRNHKGYLDDHTAIRLANLLGIEPAYIIACVHSERAKHEDEKAVWREIIERFGGVAAGVLLTFAACAIPSPDAFAAGASFNNNHDCNIHYTKRLNRRKNRWRSLFQSFSR